MMRVIPPEVELDHCGRQVLAKRDDGSPFSRYIGCSEDCGFAIGVGDAIESVAHNSCLERRAGVDRD